MAYKIKPGDTLSAIAKHQGTTVDEILKLNPNITDPNLIYTGADLILPGVAPQPIEQQPVGGVVRDQPIQTGGATTTPVIQPTGQQPTTPQPTGSCLYYSQTLIPVCGRIHAV